MTTDVGYPAVELTALRQAGGRVVTRRFRRVVLLLLAATPFVLALVPWQQNLPGTGRVIEFDPVHRPMPLQARTDGSILRWHVREGQQVAAGDPIVELADNDAMILERLGEQIEAAMRKRDAAIGKREQYEQQVLAAEQAREAAIRLADDEIAAAEQAVVVAQQAVVVAEATLGLAETAEAMWGGLVDDRIGAGFELERARQQRAVAAADLAAKRAAVAGAEATLRARRSARERVARAEVVKVQDARAKRDEAAGDVADADGAIPRLRRDLERQRQQRLVAPVDGYVQNLLANGQGGGFVKQGQTLAILVPKGRSLAVELTVDGNDVTFIDVGRHVRLQFEGWPAIQLVGWPSTAVGTFGGRVAFVDRFADAQGNFRVMVVPADPDAWPGEPFLRQGVRVKGWIVLDRVSLGFEIWRQLNGFPPSVARPPAAAGAAK
ncbi:MAG: HlyD family efflux transporter periplasmic adaptor subunit [Planctomycetes bacterium]|nr:HlyD family efflux transporter periplasmic adaptor subunit [Planctomycetota bacterium]